MLPRARPHHQQVAVLRPISSGIWRDRGLVIANRALVLSGAPPSPLLPAAVYLCFTSVVLEGSACDSSQEVT